MGVLARLDEEDSHGSGKSLDGQDYTVGRNLGNCENVPFQSAPPSTDSKRLPTVPSDEDDEPLVVKDDRL
jgi:hypothetical protein